MTTIRDLVADTRRMAYGSLHDQINLIGTPAAAGARTINLQYDITGITYGMTLSSGLNVWYVTNVDPTTNSVMVIPGYDNSPQDAVATDDFVYIKPRVTDWFLFNAVNEEIVRLSSPESGLYKIGSWAVEVDATYQTYAIPQIVDDSLIGLLRVRYRMPGTTDVWIDIPERAYRMQVNEGTSYIRILRNIPSGTDIEFLYKGSFTKAASLADDPVADCGLTETMLDIPPLGAFSSLMRTTDSRRNQVQQQGDARRAGEVGSGSNLATMQAVDRDYKSRIAQEYARLTQRVPLIRSL